MEPALSRCILPFVTTLIVSLASLSAPAFADAPPAERRTLVLKVYELPNPRDSSVRAEADRAIVRAFHEKYPDIELRSTSGITIQGMSMDSRPLMAIAAGMSPDVLFVNFRLSETYISQGFLYPLDEFIASDPTFMAELKESRIPKPVWPVVQRKGPDGREHIWALPHNIVVRALRYRKDLFAEVGLDPERPPRDWDEFEAYARRLTQPDKGTYGLLLHLGPQAAWNWIGFLWSLGGDAVAQDAEGEWRAIFNSDAAAQSLRYFIHLQTHRWRDPSGKWREGYTCKESPQMGSRLWSAGRIGMGIGYLQQDEIGRGADPALIGVAPVPMGPTGLRGSEINAGMMGMFSGIEARHGFTAAEIREAAWKWIWFRDCEEARAIRTRVYVEAGSAALYNPLYLEKYGYTEYLDLAPREWVEVFREAMEHGKPEPYGKNCQAVFQYMTYPLTEALQLAYAGRLGDTETEQVATIKGLLDRAVARTNEEMIGILPPEERSFRNRVAAAVGTLMVSVFLIVLWRVWNTFRPPEASVHGGWGFRKYWPAYVIMLPAVLSVFVWKYLPMIMGSEMVFQDYRIVGDSQWVGLTNLADVLWDRTWWASVVKTFYYMLLLLGIGFWTPIVLAILLTEVSHGKTAYRTIYYLPAVLSGMVVLYLWKLMYDKSEVGVLNQIIGLMGVAPQKWLDDSSLAMICCVIPSIWAGMGPKCLLYLAALKTVPDDLYEAADLDNCGFLGKVRHITVPTLKGLIIINFIGEFIAASQNAHMILVMTFGGPGEATKVAGLYIFEKAYLMLRFGSATTMAWLLGIMMLGFTTIQLKRLSRMEFSTADQARAKRSQA